MLVKSFRIPNKKTLFALGSVAVLAIAGICAGLGTSADAKAANGQPTNDLVIVLDAGHGGMDGGGTTADGVPEKGINLNILLNLRDLLRVAGYQVEVTRDIDTSIHDKGIEGIANQKSSDMDNRLALFNKYDNAICISIHQNLFTDPKYSGAQMFYSDQVEGSQELAKILQETFVENIQPENTREIKLSGKELFLCYFSENPTVMVECGFLSNPDEAAKLQTEEYQKEIAFSIFSAINEYSSL
ncbi:MAG: N-acetylmuramoyl-L-alanine amidase [Oscillospiraceae bacterium]|jgi:N-acetylmuramoyl-L-alanine amidase|nr:N-acetylmuramoyl-L-alanine amidase [Oscillospiraceae bacterium]